MKGTSILFLIIIINTNIFAQERGFKKIRLDQKDHIALVIGNSNYPDMPLENPKNDADAVAEAFEGMGFIVEKVLDADKENMAMAIDRFTDRLKKARVAVFYFAGHGMQVDGKNYLIPIGETAGEQITKQEQVPYRAVNVGEILALMENEKIKFSLIVLDACRNNPIKGSSRGKIKGLASIDSPAGSLVMYATKSGHTAKDGAGKNSPFTIAFLKHITEPGLDVNLLPSRVTKTVRELTNGAQTPGSYVQVTQSFTFVPALTPEELEQKREKQQAKLTVLQQKEANMKRKQENEDAEIEKQQAEIDELEEQIAVLKEKTASGEGNLDEMLKIIEQREKKKVELDAMREKAEEDRRVRENEIADMKKKKYIVNISKYDKIASSEYGQDMKSTAWNTVLENLGFARNSIRIGDTTILKLKFFELPYNFTDKRNGKTYKIKEIGSQIWMIENLAYKTDRGCWSFDNNNNNAEKFGYLYNYETAKNVCPQGFRLPTKNDFDVLLENCADRSEKKIAYKVLTSESNSSFPVLFGGWRDPEGKYHNKNSYTNFWSASAFDGKYIWNLHFDSFYKEAYMNNDDPNSGFYVRCIQNK